MSYKEEKMIMMMMVYPQGTRNR